MAPGPDTRLAPGTDPSDAAPAPAPTPAPPPADPDRRGDPPPGDPSRVEQLISEARGRLDRLAPEDVLGELAAGAALVDIRPQNHRERDGEIPGAVVICRNVLEWRCDPSSEWRDERTSDPARRLIVICNEGFQSSLAAATLQSLGHPGATDVIGGFRAWLAAKLPVGPAKLPVGPSYRPEPEGRFRA